MKITIFKKFTKRNSYEIEAARYTGLIFLIYGIVVSILFYGPAAYNGQDFNKALVSGWFYIGLLFFLYPAQIVYAFFKKFLLFLPNPWELSGLIILILILVLEGIIVGFFIGKLIKIFKSK